jgi:hypothetical protein
MVADLSRKFRILADVVHAVNSGKTTLEDLKATLASKADLKKTEVESITRLAKEFGFIHEDKEHKLHATNAGLAFERYVTVVDSQVMKSITGMPKIDRGTELKVCITVPPMWVEKIKESFGDVTEHTLAGQKLVAEDAETRLIVVTPYLDVGIMQVALKDIYAKNAELVIMTSEPSLAKAYPSGINFKIQKLEALIRSRFKSGKVLFISEDTTLAHAKVWCSDRSLLVTSANVKPDSTADNLEIGIYTDDPGLVSTMRSLLDQILNMEGIMCLLKIPP